MPIKRLISRHLGKPFQFVHFSCSLFPFSFIAIFALTLVLFLHFDVYKINIILSSCVVRLFIAFHYLFFAAVFLRLHLYLRAHRYLLEFNSYFSVYFVFFFFVTCPCILLLLSLSNQYGSHSYFSRFWRANFISHFACLSIGSKSEQYNMFSNQELACNEARMRHVVVE